MKEKKLFCNIAEELFLGFLPVIFHVEGFNASAYIRVRGSSAELLIDSLFFTRRRLMFWGVFVRNNEDQA